MTKFLSGICLCAVALKLGISFFVNFIPQTANFWADPIIFIPVGLLGVWLCLASVGSVLMSVDKAVFPDKG